MGTFIRILLVSISFLICTFYFDAVYLRGWPFKDWPRSEIGVFGDAWGFMTSIFSIAAFFGVLVSIKYQIDAFKQSEMAAKNQFESLRVQNFENNFFRMLELLQSLIQDLDIKSTKGSDVVYSGRDVFYYFYKKKFTEIFSNLLRNNNKFGVTLVGAIEDSFKELYELRQQDLGHYFRFVYNIFKYVDDSHLSDEQRKDYSRILRAQLSNYELLIIFYNCLTSYGKKFSFFAEKYEIFDNLPIKELLWAQHQGLIKREAFGNNPDYNEKYPFPQS